MSGIPKRSAARVRGRAVRSRHADQLHAWHLGELLQGVEAESTAADDGQSDLTLIHQALQFESDCTANHDSGRGTCPTFPQ